MQNQSPPLPVITGAPLDGPADCTLACDEGHLTAHKIMLCAHSKYLQDILGKFPDAEHPIIILTELNITDIKILVNYMYTGELIITNDGSPTSLLRAAQILKIDSLTDFDDDDDNQSNQSTQQNHQYNNNNNNLNLNLNNNNHHYQQSPSPSPSPSLSPSPPPPHSLQQLAHHHNNHHKQQQRNHRNHRQHQQQQQQQQQQHYPTNNKLHHLPQIQKHKITKQQHHNNNHKLQHHQRNHTTASSIHQQHLPLSISPPPPAITPQSTTSTTQPPQQQVNKSSPTSGSGGAVQSFITKDANNKIRCHLCNIGLSDVKCLYRHVLTRHLPEKWGYKCEFCDREFSRDDHLMRHYTTKHKNMDFNREKIRETRRLNREMAKNFHDQISKLGGLDGLREELSL